MTDSQDKQTKQRRVQTGVVRTRSGDQTISVTVETLVKHPVYEKYIRRRARRSVHDPRNEALVGDVVEIAPCRRMSKSKSWRLLRVVRRSAIQA